MRPYANAQITLEVTQTKTAKKMIKPTQKYVLNDTIDEQRRVLSSIVNSGDIYLPATQNWATRDIFDVGDIVFPKLSDDKIVSAITFDRGGQSWIYMPPIIEVESDGTAIVADGMHRMRTLLKRNHIFTVLVVRGASHPYYADPEESWDDVKAVDKQPEQAARKVYRRPDDPKFLFRDYNAVFDQTLQPKRG